MAYLDDNNDNLYTGGDPLEDLDRELAELRKTLGELDADPKPQDDSTSHQPAVPADIEETADTDADIDTEPVADRITQEADEPERFPESNEEFRPERRASYARRSSPPPKKRRVLPVVIVVVLIAALVGAGAYGVYRLLNSNPFAKDADQQKETTIIINDSIMGDVEIDPVEGAEVNTYTKDGLSTADGAIPVYYENGEKISHLGVDLSEFQGDVDFAAMKAAGAEFVMLRIGGRFYGDESALYEDKMFDTYYEQATAAGLKVGAYFFSQAISAEDAKEEANFAINKLNGKKLDYPIAFDWENIAEDEARTDTVTGDQLTAIAEAFCDTINAAGYKSIVYSNTQQMFIMYDFETMKDYDFWLADYRDFPTMYYKFDMWQYTIEGTIDGVEGTVDLNLSFTDFS